MYFLFIILPTLIFYQLIGKKKIIKSKLFHLSMAWFLGQYVSLLIILCLATVLAGFTSGVLSKAVYIYLFVIVIGEYLILKYQKIKIGNLGRFIFSRKIPYKKVLILAVCFWFSYIFFAPHLTYEKNVISTSLTYWDFNIHFPIIQNFVYGDNFPPQNESFANLPMTYHYFYDLLNSIYSVLGLNIVSAMNIVSIIMFFAMFAAIIGFCEEFISSANTGLFAVLFTITSSSMHFVNYFNDNRHLKFFDLIKSIFTNTSQPYFFGFINGNPTGYNASMFNVFYFLAERQMIFGILFMIFAFALIYYRSKFSLIFLFLAGCLMGQFFEGHLFIVISAGAALGFLLLFDNDRKRTLFLLLGFGLVFGIHAIYLRSLIQPENFDLSVKQFPAINMKFPTMGDDFPLSYTHFFIYYLYGYGFKILFFAIGLWILFRKNRKFYLVMLSFVLPTFILINSIQLSPLSVYDNHKWLVPMNILVNVTAAVGLYFIFFHKKRIIMIMTGILFFVLLTLSGLIELMPFLNSKPIIAYANYPTRMIEDIRKYSPPQSVFMSKYSRDLHLAGRKLYLGSSVDESGATSFLTAGSFNKFIRQTEMDKIYLSGDIGQFCSEALRNKIDYVASIPDITFSFPRFYTVNENNETVVFLDIKKGCRK